MESKLRGWQKRIGKKSANVIHEMAPKWVFNGYLGYDHDSIAGIGIARCDEETLILQEWANENIQQYYADAINDVIRKSYEDVMEDFLFEVEKKSDDINIPFIGLQTITMNDPKAYIAIGVLRTEEFIFFIFAPVREEEDISEINICIFEQIYAICRTLAPQSEYAFEMADRHLMSESFNVTGVPLRRRLDAIRHVEMAFGCNLFSSIKEWRTD